jgi:hypothetical protein
VSGRVELEVALLRSVFGDLRYEPQDRWVLLPGLTIPAPHWREARSDFAFRIPPTEGEAPYGFWVKGGLTSANGSAITNYTFPSSTAFGGEFGMFSWAPETWAPHPDVARGSNMLTWVRSFIARLVEGP